MKKLDAYRRTARRAVEGVRRAIQEVRKAQDTWASAKEAEESQPAIIEGEVISTKITERPLDSQHPQKP